MVLQEIMDGYLKRTRYVHNEALDKRFIAKLGADVGVVPALAAPGAKG